VFACISLGLEEGPYFNWMWALLQQEERFPAFPGYRSQVVDFGIGVTPANCVLGGHNSSFGGGEVQHNGAQSSLPFSLAEVETKLRVLFERQILAKAEMPQ
jgi:hypothetical protein